MRKNNDLQHYLVTGFLIAVITLLLVLIKNQNEDKIKSYRQNENEFLLQLDTIQRSLETSRTRTDSLLVRVDSVHRVNENLSRLVESKDQQIRLIKGRYNNVSQDSLGTIMDARARKNN